MQNITLIKLKKHLYNAYGLRNLSNSARTVFENSFTKMQKPDKISNIFKEN